MIKSHIPPSNPQRQAPRAKKKRIMEFVLSRTDHYDRPCLENKRETLAIRINSRNNRTSIGIGQVPCPEERVKELDFPAKAYRRIPQYRIA
jgi:hypothetical protein